MSILHSVVLPDGTTATRTSEKRSYSHVILLGPETKASVLDRENRLLGQMRSTWDHAQKMIGYAEDGGEFVLNEHGHLLATGLPTTDDYRGIGWVDRNGKFLGMEGDAYAEQVINWFKTRFNSSNVEAQEAKIRMIEAGPDLIGNWSAVSWAGRWDLAQKGIVRYRTQGREIRIAEAVRTVR
tara:strand:+ start:2369 stop:2914 length:546 start_codon:yes stop_codon:yes gene_type:complete